MHNEQLILDLICPPNDITCVKIIFTYCFADIFLFNTFIFTVHGIDWRTHDNFQPVVHYWISAN